MTTKPGSAFDFWCQMAGAAGGTLLGYWRVSQSDLQITERGKTIGAVISFGCMAAVIAWNARRSSKHQHIEDTKPSREQE